MSANRILQREFRWMLVCIFLGITGLTAYAVLRGCPVHTVGRDVKSVACPVHGVMRD